MPSPPVISEAPPRILAISNDPTMRAVFRDLLQEEGYHVSTHTCVDPDMTEIATLQPTLIVLDYLWANEDASDAFWSLLLSLRMHPATAAIPIVLCMEAGYEVEPLPPHLGAMGISLVLKPFTIDQLAEVIDERIGTDQAARQRILQDLRSPLTVVMGRVQLLRRHLRRDNRARVDADLDAIEAAIARLLAALSASVSKTRPE
jgi:CheY-like chemotaxis protein